ncbi:MAG TPA: GNAT family N-acetyltransferase [Roseiarcus sp.]|nr:GNAT family N-acetyltransferase [Roseiarcus sp.]
MSISRRVTAADNEAGQTDMDKWRQGGLTVRAAVVEDLDAIAKLERDSFPEDQVSRRSISYFLRAPQMPVIVAAIDRELAGYALLSLRKVSQAVRIYSIAVDARFARRGVALALLQACEKYARLHRKSQLTLEVRYDNAPAIALYEKWGFRQFGEHEDYYADGATALRYRKFLHLGAVDPNRNPPPCPPPARKRRRV